MTEEFGKRKKVQAPHIRALVLDATPLITNSYTHYQNYAEEFYTTPTVFHEIKDEQARKNLEIWKDLGALKLLHPNQVSIDKVSKFAKLTGDYSVLSANDIHILALTYELETTLNKGDWRLRKNPGDSLDHLNETETTKTSKTKKSIDSDKKKKLYPTIAKPVTIPKETKKEGEQQQEVEKEESDLVKKKKNRRRGGKKQKAKREALLAAANTTEGDVPSKEEEEEKKDNIETVNEGVAVEDTITETHEKEIQGEEEEDKDSASSKDLTEEFSEADDDGDWITPENLTETIIKDSGEDTTGSQGVEAIDTDLNVALTLPKNQVALATGDFAVQNVALQMNLNLMNFMSGLRIKRLRNYMLRCHACFKLFPASKDGKVKHFCPSCGGQGTLLRCAVSVDSETGKITPHLKANFQWNNRGNRYSMASPLSKNSQKRYGKKGYDHTKQNLQQQKQGSNLLREDQREYEQVMKQEDWTRRHNEKVLNNWIGGGSADNYISPFAISGLKQHSVRVGKGRYANSSKRK
ncbi:rRNA-binding endoribonuclease NDAI_0H00670 [Naumovozyma dairenensis CBS 421]|uniref:20S-pre-rRNA D-site endonuclease NOB1 n=1 Tax=Naumovozyma dairenensis (strain ATCC 10597 / BCRC 20456 / CBS 421 / NBRC 0211 / NRRL Y-12639) TaxID=1071378 RepID=G0WEN0_NAUDC|nr:hypothetical protein NDAI_0H00670 [Naumovozyma dairenensis CBS 421]CCD26241.1 hypothetical protein NDAI_0H00670 [Naumovozyma dairenensis CBS 421]